MEATATSIQAFFEENVSVPEVRAVLLALEGVAEARRLGLRLLQGAMSGLRESNSWVTKACLLHFFPQAIRACTSGATLPLCVSGVLPGELQRSAEKPTMQSGVQLGWCAREANKRLLGPFEMLFMSLAEELSTAASKGEYEYVLLLLDSWGVHIGELDHNLLSRAGIFVAIQNVLELSLSLSVGRDDEDWDDGGDGDRAAHQPSQPRGLMSSSTSFCPSSPPWHADTNFYGNSSTSVRLRLTSAGQGRHPGDPAERYTPAVVRAAMKLCFALARQVARPCLILSCLVLPCLVLSCLVLSCLVLSCLVLSCLVLSYLVLSCVFLPFTSLW
jgi:hypothetical protein